MPKFIIIRGPSGSGKSTVAKALQTATRSQTLLLSEDDIRFKFSDWKQPDHKACKQLALVSIMSGLESGFDVIYEGISDIKTYDEYFQIIFAEHAHDNYFFYLNVSFEETLRRHTMRPQKSEFGPEDMKRWQTYASPTNYVNETIISQDSSVVQTVNTIMKIAKCDH